MPPWPFFSPSSPKPGISPAVRTRETTDDVVEHTRQTQRGGRSGNPYPEWNFEDLSSRVPPFADAPSTRPQRQHGRSLSATLPSLFGIKKPAVSDQEVPSRGNSPLSAGTDASPPSSRKKSKDTKTDEGGFETGTCATCSSKVRWPANVVEFRCGTCLMINSLRPARRKPPAPAAPGQAFARAGTYPGIGVERRTIAMMISLDRTRAIIDRCIDNFLEEVIRPAVLPVETTTSPSAPAPAQQSANLHTGALLHTHGLVQSMPSSTPVTAQFTPTTKSRSSTTSGGPQTAGQSLPLLNTKVIAQPRGTANGSTWLSPVDHRSQPLPPPPPTRQAPPIPAPTSAVPHSIPRKAIGSSLESPTEVTNTPITVGVANEAHTRPSPAGRPVFKALEDYIVHSFGHHTSLNNSFSSLRPRIRKTAKSHESVRGRHDVREDLNSQTELGNSQLSDIDAKTLLLGDFAENGLWWTGDARSNSAGRDQTGENPAEPEPELVHPRSARVDWITMNEWYRMVIGAGEDWKGKLRDSFNPTFTEVEKERLLSNGQDLDIAFRDARLRVQKTLLKASEVLLKRPGCAIKSPNDIRFVLILLANPLLYPVSSSTILTKVASDLAAAEVNPGIAATSGMEATPKTRGPMAAHWERGNAFGIIKRTLGLLSNLSNECHRYLTSWFTRYREDRFLQLLQMVQSFVTHRLSRQDTRKRADSESLPSFIPSLSGTGTETSAQLHAALGLGSQSKSPGDGKKHPPLYSDDWQIRAAARIMSLLFAANRNFQGERARAHGPLGSTGSISGRNTKVNGQLISTSQFYNLKLDSCNLIADFETWETSKSKFAFCQYPFFLSVGSKIRIMEHDAHRQMEVWAREAFFESVLRNRDLEQYLRLKVRRECLVEDSLTAISQVVGQGQQEVKKGLRVHFVGEEGIDAGGLRKEWFLLLVREIFEPNHGMFTYDDESHFCYFNPHAFEASEQYFLVGALLGLAIYNSTILDVALPPFLFKKLLASGPASGQPNSFNRTMMQYTLEDLSEYRPSLAKGLRQLLEFEGDVQETFCRDFVVDVDRYGSNELVPLCTNGRNRAVTNSSRKEFVDLYIRFILDTQVARQFEPFKRGFFTVCGGNALSLFQPEEIELLVRGSDEALDVATLRAVAVYDNWALKDPAQDSKLVRWFWEFLESAEPKRQRKVLGFITGSDRIPALGITSLVIKIGYAGREFNRFPIARTCFNLLLLYSYRTKEELVGKLWRAVCESEGFGLK